MMLEFYDNLTYLVNVPFKTMIWSYKAVLPLAWHEKKSLQYHFFYCCLTKVKLISVRLLAPFLILTSEQ